jgi:hypothetical protein
MRPLIRSIYVLVVLGCVCAAARAQEASQPEVLSLIKKAVENDKANDKKAHDYMYIEREAHESKGKTEVKTKEVFFLYGHEFNRLIAKDDKPLSEKEAKKEEERIAKETEKLKNRSAGDLRKEEEKRAKEDEQGRKVWDEVAEAFDFKMEPIEPVNGREAWVVNAEPRKEYHPRSREAKILQKIRFKVWIDKAETQIVRIDGDVIDDISLVLALAKVQKGAHFTLEQMRVNDEVWLPQHIAVNAGARLLFKHIDVKDDMTYRDYRKFRSEARITGVVDGPPPPPPQQP